MSVECLLRPCEPEASAYAAAVELRPLEPGDSGALLEIFDGLGPRSRELRFLTAKPRLTSADLRQLTDVDQHDHVAILAVSVAHGRPVGVARFVREPEDPRSADVAVEVVDAWQNHGVGTILVTELARRASEVGVRRFTLVMARANEAAHRLMHRAPGEIEQLAVDREDAEFAITLGDPAAGPWQPEILERLIG
jgi:acetyltransferase